MRWVARARRRVSWLYVTRALGIAGLIWETVFDKVDKPSVMIVLGAMVLGTEGLSLGRRKTDDES